MRAGIGGFPSSFVLGNSVGVAITQPRVEVRSASTLGTMIKDKATLKELRLAVGVTRSEVFPVYIL